MFPLETPVSSTRMRVKTSLAGALALLMTAGLVLLSIGNARAQSSQTPSSQTPQTQPPAQQKPAQPTSGEAGGPTGDLGPIIVPKKKEKEDIPPPRRAPNEKTPDFTITTNVPLVQLDVLVTSKDGQFIPNLKKEHFRVFEDGVAQTVTNFSVAEAPITAVLLVEFANTPLVRFTEDWFVASYTFAENLKKDDWVAVISYDMKPEILADFTQNKRDIYSALNRLRIPGFAETNLFDALYDTIDRVDGIEGRKYIVLVSSGCDSFSKLTYDKILKKVQATSNIGIYAVGTGQALRNWADANGYMGALSCTGGMNPGVINRLDFLQADNQLTTFARLTGGRAYFPRFEGEMPGIFADIAAAIRHEYVLAYHPTNSKLDGSYRKLKVEVIDNETGKPLKVVDQKGKEVKYQVVAREGYTAKHQVD